MEDDLKNGRRPQKWKTTSKMEDGVERVNSEERRSSERLGFNLFPSF